MPSIYQVLNSYHLMEGLDSEFLVIAESVEHAKEVCLQLLAEDQDSHVRTIKDNIQKLEKSLQKDWGDGPNAAIYERANARSRENIAKYTKLLQEFHGYKRECLSVRQISPRLKNGHIQYVEEQELMM